MAIELCKVAIWIETVEPGKPLDLHGRRRSAAATVSSASTTSPALAKGIPDEAYSAAERRRQGCCRPLSEALNAKQRGRRRATSRARLAFLKPPEDLVSQGAPDRGDARRRPGPRSPRRRAEFEAWQDDRIGSTRSGPATCGQPRSSFRSRIVPPSPGLYEVPLTDNVWTAWYWLVAAHEPRTRAVEKAAR